MPLQVSLILAVTFAPVPTVPGASVREPCDFRLRHAETGKDPIRPKKLGELPPADQVLTVYRSVDGCPTPVVVRRDIGSPER